MLSPMKNQGEPPTPSVSEMLELSKQLGLLERDPALHRLFLAALASRGSDHLALLLWRRIQPQVLIAQSCGDPIFASPPPGGAKAPGPWTLGRIEATGAMLNLSLSWLVRGVFLPGSHGSGKTTAARAICRIVAAERPVCVFSLNREYRSLVPEFGFVRCDRVNLNPLHPPPGVKPIHWAGIICTVFTQTTDLLSASRSLLQQCLVALYGHYRSESSGVWPSLFDLREFLHRYKVHPLSREAGYRSAILNRLDSILMTSGDIYRCSTGHSLVDLLSRSIVWESDGLSPEHEAFYVLSILFWIFHYRLTNRPQETGLELLIVLDEAQRLLSRSSEYNREQGFPLASTLISQVRKTGIGLVVACQSPSLVLTSAIQNTATKLVFQMRSGNDIHEITSSMRLSKAQGDMLPRLAVGQCIAEVPDHPEPFLVRIIPRP